MSSNLYPVSWGEPELALTVAAGLTHLELWGSPLEQLPAPASLERLAVAAQALGLTLWTLHAPYGFTCNLAARDEQARRHAVGVLIAALDRAQAAGISLVVVHGGLLEPAEINLQAALVRAVRSLNELYKRASQRSLKLALEYLPPDTGALGAGLEQLLFMRDLMDGELQFCADVCHIHPGEDPAMVLRTLGEAIATVHLSDNDGVNVECHWLPGKGQISWPSVVAALDDIGYSGPMLIEAHTGYEPDLPRVLQALATCGREVLGCI